MSDPFSIALGVITVLDVAAKCAKTLNGLIKEYKHAPDEIFSLNNEIEDLRTLLAQLEDVTDEIRSPSTLMRMGKVLEEAKSKLKDLQNVIDLFVRKSQKGKLSLFKAWKKRRRDVAEWRDEVARLKQDLEVILVAETSMSTSRIESSLDGISVRFGMMQNRLLTDTHNFQTETRDMISLQTTSLCTVEKGQRDMQTNQEQILSMLRTLVTQADTLTKIDPNTPPNPSSNDGDDIPTIPRLEHPFLPKDFLTVTVSRKTRLGCKAECSCCCHRRSSTRTPEALKRIFGSLHIGYNGSMLPWGQYCDVRSCRGSHKAVSCDYHFPQWWTNKVISSSLFFGGPILQISVRNTITWDTKFYVEALKKEVSLSRLKVEHCFLFVNLIRNGTISLLDRVSHRAYDTERTLLVDLMSTPTDLLHVTTIMSLNNIDFECQEDNGYTIGATIGNIWFFGFPRTTKNLIGLEGKLNYSLFFDGVEATTWHRVSYRDFNEDSRKRLRYDGYDMDTPDIFGRTPLHWACRFLNVDYIKELISLGANVQVRDLDGRTPMHYLILYMYEARECDIHTDIVAYNKGPCQCQRDVLELAKLLHSADADINAVDNFGRSVVFPGVATRFPKLILLDRLVSLGLDVNFRNENGFIQLIERYEAHYNDGLEILEWMTARGVSYEEVDSAGETILFKFARSVVASLRFRASRRSRRKFGDAAEKVSIAGLEKDLLKLSTIPLERLDTTIVSAKEGLDVRAYFRNMLSEEDMEELKSRDTLKYYHAFLQFLDKIDEEHNIHFGKVPRRITGIETEYDRADVPVEDHYDDDDDDDQFEDAVEEL